MSENDKPKAELTPGDRWELGIDHDPRAVEMFEAIALIDYHENDDYCGWKSGGDGDNGEDLMYLLDCYFARKDAGRVVTDDVKDDVKNARWIYGDRGDTGAKFYYVMDGDIIESIHLSLDAARRCL